MSTMECFKVDVFFLLLGEIVDLHGVECYKTLTFLVELQRKLQLCTNYILCLC